MNYRMTGVLALLLAAAPLTAQTTKMTPKITPKVTQRVTPKITPKVQQAKVASAKITPTNVRLTFFLIQGDGFTNDDVEIRPLVVELRKVFRFTGYRLASKSVLQAGVSEWAEVQQVVNDPDGNSYLIRATVGQLTADGHMFMQVRLYPGSSPREVTLIDASVNLSDGKTVILGSALGGKEHAAIILAVSPTIEK